MTALDCTMIVSTRPRRRRVRSSGESAMDEPVPEWSPIVTVPTTRLLVPIGSGILIVLVVLGFWLRHAGAAPQTVAPTSRTVASEVTSSGDVHALARLEPASGL